MKEQERRHFAFHNKCEENNILTVPAFSHILKNQRGIHLHNYRMDQALLEAFCEHMNGCTAADERQQIDTLIINNCGFSDSQVARILQVLQPSKVLKQIQLAHDTIGNASIDLLCKCIGVGQKTAGLRKLSLNQVRVPDPACFRRLFEQLEHESALQQLGLVNVNLASDSKTFEGLVTYLQGCPHLLTHLKLQNNNFKSRHLLEIS